jgi:hypothetical protein
METAQKELTQFMTDLLDDVADAGQIRTDISPVELAEYCVHALIAAMSLKSNAAVNRLVELTLDGLRTARPTAT